MTDQLPIPGQVRGVYLGQQTGTFITTPQDKVEATFKGFAGDLHAGWTRLADSRTPWVTRGTLIRNDRQVSLVSVEELAQVARAIGVPHILAEWLGANLLIEGIQELTLLPPFARLVFSGGTILSVTGENKPCMGPGKVIEAQTGVEAAAFVKAAKHKRGLVACMELPGIIRPGETVDVIRS